jgi:hypothetical protein
VDGKIRVDENRSPYANGQENHCPPTVLLLPKHCIKTMGAPEGSDSVACEVNVDGREYDRDEDCGVESGEFPLKEGNPAGD